MDRIWRLRSGQASWWELTFPLAWKCSAYIICNLRNCIQVLQTHVFFSSHKDRECFGSKTNASLTVLHTYTHTYMHMCEHMHTHTHTSRDLEYGHALQFFSTACTHFQNFASFFSKLYTQIQELHKQNAKCLTSLAKWSTAFKISQTHLKSKHLQTPLP